MEVESSYPKYSDRVPPLDLSEVDTDCGLDVIWTSKYDFINSSASNVSYESRNYTYHSLQQNQYNIQQPSSKTNNYLNTSSTFVCDLENSSDLPSDPRDWTRADVWKWLISMAISEGLEVTSELTQKFPMNGKALCLMSLDMYLNRVPVGGKMLYRDFRVRLAKAMSTKS